MLLARATRRAVLTGLATLLVGLGAGGCGGKEGGATSPSRPEHTSWQACFRSALDALARRDLDALRALLTPDAKQALHQDLTAFCQMLAHPEEGPRMVAKVRARWPEVPADLIERAQRGDVRAGWELFMTAAVPPGVPPQQGGLKIDPARPDVATVLYRYGDGPEQPIVLQRVKGLWAVQQLVLGGR